MGSTTDQMKQKRESVKSITKQWNSSNKSNKKKKTKNGDSLIDLQDSKPIDFQIGVSKGREGKGQKNYLKKQWLKNTPNLGKNMDIQIQEAQRVPNKMNLKRLHQGTFQLRCQK